MMIKKGIAAVCFLLSMAATAEANQEYLSCLTSDFVEGDVTREEFVQILDGTSRTFGIAPEILVAIKRTESGLSLNSRVRNHNANGTIDRGFYQVNVDVWFPVLEKLGMAVSEDDFHDVYKNSMFAGWVLRRQMERFGDDMYQAVGHYHKGGGTNQYAVNIRETYMAKFMPHLRTLLTRCA